MIHARHKHHLIVPILLVAIFLQGCEPEPQHYTLEDFVSVPKIDAHVHINSADPALIEQARTDNFKLLSVNVDYPDFPPIDDQLDYTVHHHDENPDCVAFASTFGMTGWDDPGWQKGVLRHLDDTFAKGAIAVKVWKNIGMDFHDGAGNNIMIDHPKFDAVFDHIRKQERVLIGHQGEPRNCWLPIEEMTVNNDREYFKNHPQYHMYLHPELPSYEDQMNARDQMLEKNKKLRFMGAHLASLEWSVDELAKFLDRFPNAVVDMAERMGQVQYQSSRDKAKVRDFFIRYQDRILYATDLTQAPDAVSEEFKRDVHRRWMDDWKYLITSETMSVPQLDEPFEGLALPKEVVDKIYRLNAERTFPGAWKSATN